MLKNCIKTLINLK